MFNQRAWPIIFINVKRSGEDARREEEEEEEGKKRRKDKQNKCSFAIFIRKFQIEWFDFKFLRTNSALLDDHRNRTKRVKVVAEQVGWKTIIEALNSAFLFDFSFFLFFNDESKKIIKRSNPFPNSKY